jgi:hypothetical protein
MIPSELKTQTEKIYESLVIISIELLIIGAMLGAMLVK